MKIYQAFVFIFCGLFLFLGCNPYRKQAKFFADNPNLIPTVTQTVQQTIHTKADTLTNAVVLDVSTNVEFEPLKARTYTFENEKSKTILTIDVNRLNADSLPILISTIVKPDSATKDTAIAYQQYQYTTPTKPQNMWQRWSNGLNILTVGLIVCALIVLRMMFK